MLRIDRKEKVLKALSNTSLCDAQLKERSDLQALIRRSPDVFFGELGQELLIIDEEVCPVDHVADRIDLLALDQQGNVVIIELKRGNHPLQLLQGLGYAAMISNWTPQQLIERLRTKEGKTFEEAQDLVEDFIEVEIDDINSRQRAILIAENYDYEVLATAQWLTEKYGMDCQCYKLVLATDETGEFLSCTCIFPLPELHEQAIVRGRRAAAAAGKSESQTKWPDWETALADLKDENVVEFFRQELKAGVESNLADRVLHYRIGDDRRWHLWARKKKASAWQNGRFNGDVEFWSKKLGPAAGVGPLDGGRSLKFYLSEPQHFKAFREAVSSELSKMEFLDN